MDKGVREETKLSLFLSSSMPIPACWRKPAGYQAGWGRDVVGASYGQGAGASGAMENAPEDCRVESCLTRPNPAHSLAVVEGMGIRLPWCPSGSGG